MRWYFKSLSKIQFHFIDCTKKCWNQTSETVGHNVWLWSQVWKMASCSEFCGSGHMVDSGCHVFGVRSYLHHFYEECTASMRDQQENQSRRSSLRWSLGLWKVSECFNVVLWHLNECRHSYFVFTLIWLSHPALLYITYFRIYTYFCAHVSHRYTLVHMKSHRSLWCDR